MVKDIHATLDDASLATLLRATRTIALVGLSDDPNRDSHMVGAYLHAAGYEVIGVNPLLAGQMRLNQLCHASLSDAHAALRKQGRTLDLVDCFRRSEAIPALVDEMIGLSLPCLWLQFGIEHPLAVARARGAGIEVIEDRCIKIEHRRLLG